MICSPIIVLIYTKVPSAYNSEAFPVRDCCATARRSADQLYICRSCLVVSAWHALQDPGQDKHSQCVKCCWNVIHGFCVYAKCSQGVKYRLIFSHLLLLIPASGRHSLLLPDSASRTTTYNKILPFKRFIAPVKSFFLVAICSISMAFKSCN